MDKYLHLPDKCILLMAGTDKRKLPLCENIEKSDTIVWEAKKVIVPECAFSYAFFVCYSYNYFI